MTHFQIEFTCVWLLFLLIPVLALALFLHLRLEKKYRRTRNRIVSLVLHIIVATLCIFVLSGMTFSYDTENTDNEMIILVDSSYSNVSRENDKADFVRSIIDESTENYKIGIVTFGYDQVYAAQLSSDGDDVYRKYMSSKLPDDSATDIASALRFARDKLTNLDNAQIVLISDGVETDGSALSVIRSITADGVRVSVAYFDNEIEDTEIQIIGAVLPDVNPSIDDAFRLGVTIQSSTVGEAKITLFDNNAEVGHIDIDVDGGVKEYYFTCKFSVGGLHVLKFEVEAYDAASDALTVNNTFFTYINVENFNKVLIVERDDGASVILEDILTSGDNPYDVTVVNIGDDNLPSTVNELREYDQVILNNISNLDMPDGFIDRLNSYVKDFGGGMFTVGGDRLDQYGEIVPNAYNTSDMAGTLYQDMLPVQVIDYTPPVAVMIIIDKSGSMNDISSTSGQSKIAAAKEGAKSAIRALTSRDYCGIMTLTMDFEVEQSITPVTQYESLFSVIDSIEVGGGTYYTPSIERAGRMLASVTNVERRHIVLVSDGLPGDNYDSYSAAVRRNYENDGITFSVFAIGMDSGTNTTDLENAVDLGHGRFYNVSNTDRLVDEMREELKVEEIKGAVYEDFVPKIENTTSVVNGVNAALIPTLGGFYGTRKKDDQSVLVPLMGKYVPIFAQWQYGEGKVGSFMCDLSGSDWSQEFVNDETGKLIIRNIIKALMPTYNIHVQDIDVGFEEDNYTTNISVYTTVNDGEKLQVSIKPVSENSDGDIITPQAQSGYSRISVVITEPGVYEISVKKLDDQGEVIGSFTAYRAFSYSKEYDMFYDADEAELLMTTLAELGKGAVIDHAWQLFEDDVTYTHHVVDPTIAFMIIAIVLFLLDIAVRKFKFKWPHEIIRDRKAQKSEMPKED